MQHAQVSAMRLVAAGAVITLAALLAQLTPAWAAATRAASAPTQSAAADRAAITVALHPSKDNTLYESNLGTLSNGAGQHLFAGRTSTGAIRRGLLAFDVASAVPSTATVVSATLELAMSRTNGGVVDVHLHLMQADWGESSSDAAGQEGAGAAAAPGDATWVHKFFDTAAWTTPGGDFRATPSASAPVGPVGSYQWRSAQLAADVQLWLDDPASAYGWILVAAEDASDTAKRFDTREHVLADHRPLLTVAYTLPMPTPTSTPTSTATPTRPPAETPTATPTAPTATPLRSYLPLILQ
jgi:hypothetical protein